MRSWFYGFAAALVSFAILLSLASSPGSGEGPATSLVGMGEDKQLPQLVKSPRLRPRYFFAGEPLDTRQPDARERLERELLRNSYFHSNTLLILKRTTRYFPTIERILREEGVPDDLKYVAVTESDLLNVVSPSGARGLWQFMPAVGKSFDLEINDEVEERYHLEKSTRAAARHLSNYYRQFGNWQLALAAYNMGEGNMRKFKREQLVENYLDMNVNDETMRYLFRVIAMKSIIETPRQYGFYLEPADYYPPLSDYTTERVTETIPNLAEWAKKRGVSYRQLKRYNPWLIDNKLTVSKNVYEIKLPR